MRLIDADALYEQTAEWEARALAVVEKLNSKPLGEMDVNEITEWRKWSCILNERSAFKHDVADAPIVNAVEVVQCKDCKHRPTGTGANHDLEFPDDECPCQCEDYWYSWMPLDDWFCPKGERRENG